MWLQNIYLYNFKNYEQLRLQFSENINCILGENGSGKTNLLDAVHFLCIGKGAFLNVDAQHIRHKEDVFSVKGTFRKTEEDFEVLCSLQRGQKKNLKLRGSAYERISDHVGRFPCVMITPYDVDLIREGSEFRRRFFDGILSQLDNRYLSNLIRYNAVLKQRNSLLKRFRDTGKIDRQLLSIYGMQLTALNLPLRKERQKFTEHFEPVFQKHYKFISESKEEVSLNYRSPVSPETFEEDFEKQVEKDLILGRTDLGIHKDDYKFKIREHPLKRFGSQGQQKSFVIALKLAKFEVMHEISGVKPLLLLDDIFDKLDEQRIRKLLDMIRSRDFGQVFITDANPERTLFNLKHIGAEAKVFMTEEF